MSNEVIVFPDAVSITVDYLATALGDPVTSAVPNPRPAAFLVARRLGGIRGTLVSDEAQIRIEAWADLEEDAHDLAQLARAHLLAMAGTNQDGIQVYRVDELAGPASLPDPESAQPRVVFSVVVGLRGTASGS